MPDETVAPPVDGAPGDVGSGPDPVEIPLPPAPDGVVRCPWCSAGLDAPGAAACPSCGAHLVEAAVLDIPGVTAVDPGILALANRAREPKRSLGSLLIGDDAMEIPPPSQAELRALAPPDAAVRREILRMELEALEHALAEEGLASPQRVSPTSDGPGPGEGEPVAGSADPDDAPAAPAG